MFKFVRVRVRVRKHERGLLFRRGDFHRLLKPGTYLRWNPLRDRIELADTLATRFEHRLLDMMITNPELRAELEIVELNDFQRALIWIPALGRNTDGTVDVAPGADVYHARLNLEEAAALGGVVPGRASYMLSLLEQSQGRATAAVQAADDAVQADRSQARYRRQACLMCIRFWTELTTTLRERGALHCARDDRI